MKVIIAENENPYIPANGGISTYIRSLSTYLYKQGIEVILVGSGSNSHPLLSDLPFPFRSLSSKNLPNPFFTIKFFRIFKEYNQKGCILHVFHTYYLLYFLLFRKKCRVVLTLAGMQDVSFRRKRGKIPAWFNDRFITKLAAEKADLVIFVDKNTKEHYLSKSSRFELNSEIIPAFVDLDRFKPMDKKPLREKYRLDDSAKIVIYTGRLSPEKNITFLIDSFKILNDSLVSLQLLIVGNGKLGKILKQYTNEKKLQNVTFIENASDTEIVELLNCADLLALTSLYEGSPTVVKEAIACHLPVVSLDVGDVKAVVGNLEGCYISEPDRVAFSNAMKKVLTTNTKFDPADRIAVYGVNIIANLILTEYEKLGKLNLN